MFEDLFENKPQILVVKAPTKSKTHTSDIMSSSELTFSIRPFEELSLVELYEIMRLRQEVFVVEQNCPYLDADGKDLDSLHVLGFENKKLCCYCRLLPKGISYPDATSIGRVITSQGSKRERDTEKNDGSRHFYPLKNILIIQ